MEEVRSLLSLTLKTAKLKEALILPSLPKYPVSIQISHNSAWKTWQNKKVYQISTAPTFLNSVKSQGVNSVVFLCREHPCHHHRGCNQDLPLGDVSADHEPGHQ